MLTYFVYNITVCANLILFVPLHRVLFLNCCVIVCLLAVFVLWRLCFSYAWDFFFLHHCIPVEWAVAVSNTVHTGEAPNLCSLCASCWNRLGRSSSIKVRAQCTPVCLNTWMGILWGHCCRSQSLPLGWYSTRRESWEASWSLSSITALSVSLGSTLQWLGLSP